MKPDTPGFSSGRRVVEEMRVVRPVVETGYENIVQARLPRGLPGPPAPPRARPGPCARGEGGLAEGCLWAHTQERPPSPHRAPPTHVLTPLSVPTDTAPCPPGPHPPRAAIHPAADARHLGARVTLPSLSLSFRGTRLLSFVPALPLLNDSCALSRLRFASLACAAPHLYTARAQGDAPCLHAAVGAGEGPSRRPLWEVPRRALATPHPCVSAERCVLLLLSHCQ